MFDQSVTKSLRDTIIKIPSVKTSIFREANPLQCSREGGGVKPMFKNVGASFVFTLRTFVGRTCLETAV